MFEKLKMEEERNKTINFNIQHWIPQPRNDIFGVIVGVLHWLGESTVSTSAPGRLYQPLDTYNPPKTIHTQNPTTSQRTP